MNILKDVLKIFFQTLFGFLKTLTTTIYGKVIFGIIIASLLIFIVKAIVNKR